jgi:hypothetical protein
MNPFGVFRDSSPDTAAAADDQSPALPSACTYQNKIKKERKEVIIIIVNLMFESDSFDFYSSVE